MKNQLSKNLIAIGVVTVLIPYHMASAQTERLGPIPVTPSPEAGRDAPEPTVPQTGTGGPRPVDLDTGQDEATDTGKLGAAPRAELTIYEIVAGAKDYTTLAGALLAAGLDERLKANGPFTLLAPDNDAFAALPEGVFPMLIQPDNVELLRKFLNYHIIPKKLTTAELKPGEYISAEGTELMVAGHAEGELTIQGTRFGITDVMANNGVIHVIKAVLIPPTVIIEDYMPAEDEPAEGAE